MSETPVVDPPKKRSYKKSGKYVKSLLAKKKRAYVKSGKYSQQFFQQNASDFFETTLYTLPSRTKDELATIVSYCHRIIDASKNIWFMKSREMPKPIDEREEEEETSENDDE